MTGGRHLAALTPVLIFTTMVVSLISSLGAPLLPSISADLGVTLSSAQWSLTVTLLVGAVVSPTMGRLGDGPHRRQAMIVGLAAVTAGGIVAALSTNLALLVVGRGLQGVGLGLVPLTMAAARDHLPREKVHGAIALLSVCVAAGVGIGYPISGLIAQGFGLAAAFWFGAAVSFVTLVSVIVVVPSSRGNAESKLDWIGVLLLTIALVSLLLAIAEGNAWGWTSVIVIGLLALAVSTTVLWCFQQIRTRSPLVELRLLRHPAVLAGDAIALVLGVAMYMYMSGVTEYVQAPEELGYGFSASVVVAGLCLVPLSVTSLAASRALPWFTERFGVRALLPMGSLFVAGAGIFFAIFKGSIWEALVMMALLGVGIGATSAAIPGLIVKAIPESETGSAMGFYQVVRYIGFSLGSAMTAAILSVHTPEGRSLPTETGYTLVFWVAAGICVAAAILAWVLTSRNDSPQQLDQALAEEDAEMGPAGFIGVPN